MRPDRKVKIALMSYTLDGRSNSGTALYARQIIKKFINDPDLNCHLIHYKKDRDSVYNMGANEIIMPKLRLPYGSQFVSQLLFFWQYRNKKFDVIHWFQPRLYPFFWLAPAKKIIVTMHGGGMVADKNKKFYFSNFMFNLVLKIFWRNVDMAIADSYFGVKEIEFHYGVDKKRLRSIYLGVGEEYSPMEKNDIENVLKKYNIEGSYILDVSRLQPHKNIIRLIQAYELLRKNNPNLKEKLVIVGKPTTTYVEEYEVAKKSEFSLDIIFIDFVEQEDLNAIYSGAEVFVFLSLNEGFGLPVVESMASGTPVVTSNVASLPEVSGGATILVDPFDIENMAEGIRQVLSDEKLRDDLIRKGLERSKEFSWEKTANETKKIYKELLNEHE